MAQSSPHLSLEVTVLGVSIAGCEGVFASRGKRDVYREQRSIQLSYGRRTSPV